MRQTGTIRSGSNADIAFAVVVLTSYFATFASMHQASPLDILVMIILGLAYTLVGIYGYAYCAGTDLPVVKLGYFFVQIPLGGLIVTLGKGAGFNGLILLPLAGQAVVLLKEIWVYLVNGAILGIYMIATESYTGSWPAVWEGIPTFLAGQIFIMAFIQILVSEERSRREIERLVEELQDANQRLRDYAGQVEELAVTQERNRLAREIHDGLGHYLTTIHMEIQAARAVMGRDSKQALSMLEKAQGLTQDALMDVRNSVSALRNSQDENLPLPEMVEKLIQNCRMMNLDTDFKVHGNPRALPPQVYLTLFRATQESINNICKHSQATQVWVSLDYNDLHCVRLMVQDNGIGTDAIDVGFGLMGLKERVSLLNGELNIQSAREQGFRLEIIVPV